MQCCNPLEHINKFCPSLSSEKAESVVVHSGHTVEVILPKNPLAAGSLRIQPKNDISHLSEWSQAQHEETHELIIKIIDIWKKSNAAGDYMVYGKVAPGEKFAWEVVPYPKTNWKIVTLLNQIKILWNITVGAKAVTVSEQNKLSELYKKNIEKFHIHLDLKTIFHHKGEDKFCQPEVIDPQTVHHGKHTRVTNNYAPLLGKNNPHHLLMPLNHMEKYENLSKDAYVEIATDSGLLVDHYEKKGFKTIYLYSNNGTIQSQKHFHEHLIPVASKVDDIWGKMKILGRMLLPCLTSRMNANEMTASVESSKKELEPVLRKT